MPETGFCTPIAIGQHLSSSANAGTCIKHCFWRQPCGLEIDRIDLGNTGIKPVSIGQHPSRPLLRFGEILGLCRQPVNLAIAGNNFVANGVRSARTFDVNQWAQSLLGNVRRTLPDERRNIGG